ncbi:MAG: hypothetical protein K2L23_06105 [Odoribacter sp.]|nr:hypothetical protein [Odoribacter sp.]
MLLKRLLKMLKKSQERLEKLFKLEIPAPCDLAKVNELASESEKIINEVKTTATLLHKYYYNLNGKTEKGDDDNNVTKPSVAELVALSVSIKKETEAIQNANKLLPEATKEMKTVKNPMKLKAVKKSMDYSSEVMSLAVEENTAELKLITELIEQASK